jgi:hypothetical protein
VPTGFRPHDISEFIEEAKAFKEKPSKATARALAAKLRQVGIVDMRNSSQEDKILWDSIQEEWENYLEDHPKLAFEEALPTFIIQIFFSTRLI